MRTGHIKTWSKDAINKCLDLVSLTIGHLEQEIQNGKRDPDTGEKVEKRMTEAYPPIKPKAFIAHGVETPALTKLKSFLDALGVESFVVEDQPSGGRSIGEKVGWSARQADFAIILATKGDKDAKTGGFIPRGNVLIEIGKAQELFPSKTIYLLQAGTKFLKNVSEKVWFRFTPQVIDYSIIKIAQELQAFGILRAVRPQE